MHGVLAPADQPDRGVGRARAAGIDDVGAACGRERREARTEAGEALRVLGGAAVDDRLLLVLVHRLDEGHVLAHAELGGVAVEVGDRLVDFRVGLEHAGGVADLGSLALGFLDAVVQQAPGGARQAGAHRGLVAGAVVALHPQHVGQHLVGLAEQLDHRRGFAAGIETRCPLAEREGRRGKGCHVSKSPVVTEIAWGCRRRWFRPATSKRQARHSCRA